jgi:hypothetical protein
MVPMRMDVAGLLTSFSPYAAKAGAFNRADHHGEAVDVVEGGRFRHLTRTDGLKERENDAGMAARVLLGNGFGNVYGPKATQKSLFVTGHGGGEIVFPVPENHALRADQSPARFPAGPLAFGAPGAAIGKDDIIRELENGVGACSMGIP